MKLFRHKASSHSALPHVREAFYGVGRDPFIDWALIVLISFVFALLLIGIGAYAYIHVDQDLAASGSVAPSDTLTTIDAHALQAVLSGFDARASERADLVRGYGGPGDPSL